MEVQTPKEFFEKVLPGKLDMSKTAGLDAVIQINLTGPNGGNWIVTIKDQKLDVQQGESPTPSITIKMVDSDYVDMVNGKLSGERAFMTGKLKFRGSMAIGMKLKSIGFL